MSRYQPFAGKMFFRYNENHDPDNGQFTGDGGGSGSGSDSVYSSVGDEKGGKDGSKGGGKAAGSKEGGGKGPAVSGATAGGSSGAYEGKSPRNDRGSGRLEGAKIDRVFSPTASHTDTLTARGATPLTFNELGQGSGKVFHDAISAASGKFKAAVAIHTVEHYDHLRTFLTADAKSGFALDGDNIVSVFKNPDSSAKQSTASILALAVEQGGRRLDCFDTALPHIYAREGFIATSRTAFNVEYQPDGWNYNDYKEFNGGKPDVVFMRYVPDAAPYKSGDGAMYPDYDAGEAAQVAAVAASKQKRSFRSFAEACAFHKYFNRYNEEHDPDTGQFTGPGGGGAGGGGVDPTPIEKAPTTVAPASKAAPAASGAPVPKAAPAPPPAPAPAAAAVPVEKSASESKGKTKPTDFVKDKVNLRFKDDQARVDKFVDEWDSRIGGTPAEFKEAFLGGVGSTMNIAVDSGGEWTIEGKVQSGDRNVGDYTRRIDWATKTAKSDYFVLNGNTGRSTGKKILAGNVAMYQKLGIEKVEVHANIDVGGYAWAKYGYVPTARSWRSLSSDLRDKLDSNGGGGSSGYTPESWDEIGSDEQENIKDRYIRDTRADYLENEISNWRDGGQALDDAKYQLASGFNSGEDWAIDAVSDVIDEAAKDGKSPIPYTADQVLRALSAEEYNSGYEGRKDLEFTFDDSKLKEPNDAPPKEQMMLPGFKPDDLSTHLTQDMRDEITDALVKASNDKAEKDAEDMDPPDFSDSVEEYQSESWESMSDREKFRYASDNGYIREQEREGDDDGEGIDASDDEKSTLRELADSDDPKAIWAIADSERGKELLLGSDWEGVLDLTDKETMERFNAYVGKVKRAA